MTTPNIPDLPHVVAFSTGGSNSPLKVGSVDGGSVRIDVGTGNWYDPADLIRNLSPFVPIPAEARKVFKAAMIRHQRVPKGVGSGNTCAGCNHLDGESDGANSPRHVEHQVEVGFAALAAAGLLVGPGEPAASEGEPVAWLDGDGSLWYFDEGDLRNTLLPSPLMSRTIAEANEKHGPLTPLYTRPPVTAEPATAPSVTDASVGNSDATVSAPSVEQIVSELDQYGFGLATTSDKVRRAATDIRALWSPAPGGADEVQWIGRGSNEYGLLEAENERLRAALEAAKQYHWARDHFEVREEERQEAARELDRAEEQALKDRMNVAAHRDAFEAAARAAVEADTTEEA